MTRNQKELTYLAQDQVENAIGLMQNLDLDDYLTDDEIKIRENILKKLEEAGREIVKLRML